VTAFRHLEHAKANLNAEAGSPQNRQMICEMSASGAKPDPHTVGDQNQGAGAAGGFQKWWWDWNDINLMNGICNSNSDCKRGLSTTTTTTVWFCVVSVKKNSVTYFPDLAGANANLNAEAGGPQNRQMICEMSASGAKPDPHTVGGQNQGAGAAGGFQKWWWDWNDINLMNGMCNGNSDCRNQRKTVPRIEAIVVITTTTTTTTMSWMRRVLTNGNVIALNGGHSRKWCSDDGWWRVRCNRDWIKSWEMYTVFDASQFGAGKIALRGGNTGKMCADEFAGVVCNRDWILQWEAFTPEHLGQNMIALKGGQNGMYCADEFHRLVCNRQVRSTWETFELSLVR